MMSTTQPTWSQVLADEKQKPYFQQVMQTVREARRSGKVIFPPHDEMFNALTLTPFADIKVVILGQDPYHGPGQAHGLSFSVKHGVKAPPSLQNIFKEIKADLGLPIPKHGCLESWAKQGVLLLNASLSVEAHRAGSHSQIGWQTFTDKIISELSDQREGLVFLLWGAYAQRKVQLIDTKKHHILTAPHPSPLSAHRGFLGCKHFSKTNSILSKMGVQPIDWSLPDDPN